MVMSDLEELAGYLHRSSEGGGSMSFVVCFLLGDSPASEFYKPTFRNTLSVPSS
jgi:hypothetical protein